MYMRIEAVRAVGRYRSNLGDIQALAKSIATVGLLNPITVTSDGQLIAGQRRLEACRSLGWDLIGCMVADDLDTAVAHLTAERDENIERLEMTVSEKVALAKTLESLEAQRIALRQHEDRVRAGKIRQGTLDPAHGSEEPRADRAREVAGRAVGLSGSSYFKARTVIETAEDPTLPPGQQSVAQAAQADMDATGNVAGNYEKVRGIRAAHVGAPQKAVVTDIRKQRRAISSATATLSGITLGLKRIEDLHPDITSEEAAQWVDDLCEARLTIERLIKRLKERTNGKA